MRLGVPFIAPRHLGAIGAPFGRHWLPSIRERTGQSGAPPDSEQCVIPFLVFAKPTVASLWSHGTMDSPVQPGDHWPGTRGAR
jgi:hypothetical protein